MYEQIMNRKKILGRPLVVGLEKLMNIEVMSVLGPVWDRMIYSVNPVQDGRVVFLPPVSWDLQASLIKMF